MLVVFYLIDNQYHVENQTNNESIYLKVSFDFTLEPQQHPNPKNVTVFTSGKKEMNLMESQR